MNLMNSSRNESTDYQCYLLRLRRDGEERPWRASLLSSSTGTLHHFASVAHLIAFLEAQTGGVEEQELHEPSGAGPGQAG